MATLAFACAEDEGLKLVTEFPDLFQKVVSQPKEAVFEACFNNFDEPSLNSRDLLPGFFVYQRCDVSKLTPERLQALTREREAIANFKEALEELSTTLPTQIDQEEVRSNRLNDLVNDVFQRWKADRLNLSSFVRELFGDEAIKEPAKFIEKVAASALAGGAGGAVAGKETHSALLGAAAGLAVGIGTHSLTTYQRLRHRDSESPFRYLTSLQDEGVGFVLSR